jgi:hypothetical protein
VEDVLDVDLPVAAERLPGVLLDRAQQRARPGVQHQRAWLVPVDELAGDDGVGGVGDDRGERLAKLCLQVLQPGAVAGDSDDLGAGLGQRGGDGAAEASTGAGDDRRGSWQFIGWHDPLLCVGPVGAVGGTSASEGGDLTDAAKASRVGSIRPGGAGRRPRRRLALGAAAEEGDEPVAGAGQR